MGREEPERHASCRSATSARRPARPRRCSAAAEVGDPAVRAVVSRGGRPDLAGDRLAQVPAPTLLIVGGLDREVLELNRRAAAHMRCEHRDRGRRGCRPPVRGARHARAARRGWPSTGSTSICRRIAGQPWPAPRWGPEDGCDTVAAPARRAPTSWRRSAARHTPGRRGERLRPAARADRRRRIVLLGEASHGTHEFYRERARITKRLIGEKGFTAVAIEGDWPDAYRVNRYVSVAIGTDADAEEALRGFRRFPTWMWRNADVARLRRLAARPQRAAGRAQARKVGVLRPGPLQPRRLDGGGDRLSRAARTRRRRSGPGTATSACSPSPATSARLRAGRPARRQRAVPAPRDRAARRAAALAPASTCRATGSLAEDEYFFAEQNAALVADAEEYYRTMLGDRAGSWNLRDRHMADTLDHLIAHLESPRRHEPAWWSGSTTRTSAMPGPPRWPGAAKSTSAS